MPDWIRRTALADILGADFSTLSDEALYRNLDRLHPQRAPIEQALAARERTLFNLDDTIYLYDLTSTYFEGQCRAIRKPSAATRAITGRTASRSSWAWSWTATAFRRRTRSLTAIASIARPWRTC